MEHAAEFDRAVRNMQVRGAFKLLKKGTHKASGMLIAEFEWLCGSEENRKAYVCALVVMKDGSAKIFERNVKNSEKRLLAEGANAGLAVINYFNSNQV